MTPLVRSVGLALLGLVGGCASRAPMCGAPGGLLADQVLLVSLWRHDPVTTANVAWGVNLDGRIDDRTAEGCAGELDYVSPLLGGIGSSMGIDNQLQANLVPLLASSFPDGVTETILRQVLDGEHLHGLDIRIGSDGLPEAELLVLSAVETLTTGPDGRALASDQRFRVESRERLLALCLADGTLGLVGTTLLLPAGPTIGAAPIESIRIRLRIEPDGQIVVGELGGVLALSTVLTVADALALAIDEATWRSVTHPDLLPDPSTGECSAISAGVGIELVPATLVP